MSSASEFPLPPPPVNGLRRPVRLKTLAELGQGSAQSDAKPQSSDFPQPVDFGEALGLITRAADTIAKLQKRSDEFEDLSQSILALHKEKVAAMSLEMRECQQRALRSDARAEEAERRLLQVERQAQEADAAAKGASEWLSRVQDAIANTLAPSCMALETSQ